MAKLLEYLKTFDKKEFSAGDDIVKYGEESKTLYVLVEGSAEVSIEGVTIRTISEPGTVVGEISAILNIPRTAAVQAKTGCTFYEVGNISTLFKDNHEVSLEVTRKEFDRLMSIAELLLQLKNLFVEAMKELQIDFTGIPELKEYVGSWEKLQADTSENFPFKLNREINDEKEKTLNTGDILFEEGQSIETFYALKSGTINMSRKDNAFNYNISSPGTILNVGYSLIAFDTMATARAAETTVLSVVDNVEDLFKANDSAGFDLLSQVAQKIVTLSDAFAQMKNKLLNIHNEVGAEHKEKMEKLVEFIPKHEAKLQDAVFLNR